MSVSNRLAGTSFFRHAGRALLMGLMPAIHGLLSARREARPIRPVATAGPETAPPPSPSAPVTFGVEPELRSVLNAVAGAGRPPAGRLQFAAQPELMLRADRAAFRHALAALVRQAGSPVPVGRVLVTAARCGDWVEVSVSDDGPGVDRWVRLDALHPIERSLARQGATLEIASWPEQGTSVVMHWPTAGPLAPAPERAPPAMPERTEAV